MIDNSEQSQIPPTSNKVTLEVTTVISVSLPEWNRMQDELRVLRQLINGSPAHLLVGKEHFEKACSTFINHGHCVYCGFSREAHGLPALSDEPDSVHETAAEPWYAEEERAALLQYHDFHGRQMPDPQGARHRARAAALRKSSQKASEQCSWAGCPGAAVKYGYCAEHLSEDLR